MLKGSQRYSFELFVVCMILFLFFCGFGCKKSISAASSIPITDSVATDTLRKDSLPKDTLPKDTIPHPPTAYTYLALGDSYTIGTSVAEDYRYPIQVATQLNRQGIALQKPDFIATNGWTTQDLLNGIALKMPPNTYDVVSLLIGVNNQYQQRDTVGYREQFRKCLIEAVRLAAGKAGHVFVLSIPDYSVTPFGHGSVSIALQIQQYNQINYEVTTEYGINYTNITPISQQAATNSSLIASDGLHPSGQQYALWTQLLAPKIAAILQ